jgi:hypothetical protein
LESWRIYLEEALCQVDFAKRSYKEFEVALTEDDVVSVFYRLHHFIVHMTNLDKILDAKCDSSRYMLLNERVDLSEIDLKLVRKLRNHLEHFDERLDRWVSEYDGHAFFDMNLITGAKGFPKKCFLRALDGYTFKFYGEDYPLQRVYSTLIELEARLISALKH